MGFSRRGAEAAGGARLPAVRRNPAVSSRILRAVRGSNTQPERLLTRSLRRLGLRPRLQYSRVNGRPDIAFPSRRVAVFVDGDFWHGRGYRERGFVSLAEQFARWHRGDWWLWKIQGNVARDRRVTRSLRRQGWIVLRFRDSVVTREADRCAAKVVAAIGKG